ncbi:MAG: TlpA family protein disulfide reductase [Proteobacteria bacterium]|nr:TlpA family protein disulfide reductase [Pseudomonadota bacterium]HQR02716.1 TlpA disulfide reductase family protein [Rhodocyclaceae bacterium]
MKKLYAVLLCLFAFHGSLAADNAATTVDEGEKRAHAAGLSLIGTQGPDLTLKTIDGKQINLSSLRGKQPVYLKFWATWCVPCRKQMPGFEHIYQKQKKNITVIAVNIGFSDDEAAIRSFKSKVAMNMPIVIDDGNLAGALNVRVTPTHLLIGKDGHIAYIGHLDDDKLHAALARVLASDSDTGTIASAQPVTKHSPEEIFKRGDVVAKISVTTTDGKTVSLATSNGKPRALVFTAPWCESYLAHSRPAVSQACRRVRVESERLAKNGEAEWLAISSGLWASEQDLLDYKATEKINIPLALDADGKVFRAFNIRQIPTVVLMDGNNRIVQVQGPNDRDLRKAMQSLRTQ